MQMHVIASGLNLRASAPDGEVAAVLRCGHPVTVTGSDQPGWVTVECPDPGDPGAAVTGVVAERFLRPAIPSAQEALVAAALAEWRRFDYGAGHEAKTPYSGYVGEMWTAMGFPTLDGTDRQYPWSAAAISWIVRQAAKHAPALDTFEYAISHSRYIKDAIEKREAGKAAPYWGRRLNEAPARIGDMVVLSRKDTTGNHDNKTVDTYEEARDIKGTFPSHCDLIVGVSNGQAHALGGNVGQSLSMSSFALDDKGHLAAKNRVFMLLQCRL